MFDVLLKACHIFQTKTAALREKDIERMLLEDARSRGEEVDIDYARNLARDVAQESKKLKVPKAADKQDMNILLGRAASFIGRGEIPKFIATMEQLKTLAETFAPEKLDPEFTDFMTDFDTWDWLGRLKLKGDGPDAQDRVFLGILRDNLLFLAARMK